MSCCIPGCIACRDELPLHPEFHERRDIVQAQKEAWKQIRQEEREGKRRPAVARW